MEDALNNWHEMCSDSINQIQGAKTMNSQLKYTMMTAIWILNPVSVGGCYGPEFSFDEADILVLIDTINE